MCSEVIEEYKAIREEILEIDKRISNYIVYSIIATATLIGFGIEFPSQYVFLLPLVIIIPISYKILSLQNDILFKGTYISMNIEQKDLERKLNWETFLIEKRKYDSKKSNFYKQSPNTLLFNFLSAICLVGSVNYFFQTVEGTNQTFRFLGEYFQYVIQMAKDTFIISVIWMGIIAYFVFWNYKMSKCFGSETQENQIKIITKINQNMSKSKDDKTDKKNPQ